MTTRWLLLFHLLDSIRFLVVWYISCVYCMHRIRSWSNIVAKCCLNCYLFELTKQFNCNLKKCESLLNREKKLMRFDFHGAPKYSMQYRKTISINFPLALISILIYCINEFLLVFSIENANEFTNNTGIHF